jgi:hypothetical protein
MDNFHQWFASIWPVHNNKPLPLPNLHLLK